MAARNRGVRRGLRGCTALLAAGLGVLLRLAVRLRVPLRRRRAPPPALLRRRLLLLLLLLLRRRNAACLT